MIAAVISEDAVLRTRLEAVLKTTASGRAARRGVSVMGHIGSQIAQVILRQRAEQDLQRQSVRGIRK